MDKKGPLKLGFTDIPALGTLPDKLPKIDPVRADEPQGVDSVFWRKHLSTLHGTQASATGWVVGASSTPIEDGKEFVCYGVGYHGAYSATAIASFRLGFECLAVWGKNPIGAESFYLHGPIGNSQNEFHFYRPLNNIIIPPGVKVYAPTSKAILGGVGSAISWTVTQVITGYLRSTKKNSRQAVSLTIADCADIWDAANL